MTEATSFSKARWWIAISNTHSFYMLFLRSMKNILRRMKEFLAELMNRLHYFITYSIDWYYNGLDESIFFFLFKCTWKLHLISFFVHYSVIQLRYFWWNYYLNNFSLPVGLLRLVGLLMMVDTYSSWSMVIDQQNVDSYTISDEICSSTTVFIFFHMEKQSISYFEYLFFSFWTSTSCLYNLFPSFWRSNLEFSSAFLDAVNTGYHA